MRNKFKIPTILWIAAWLFSENFNLASPATSERCKSTNPAAYTIKKVVIDAGHGGKDPGCAGHFAREKHNTLAIALKLGDMIRANFPEVQVIYTRETDVFVELNERAAIANRENADLFISIHCNAISVSNWHGTETYVMGLHTAKGNLEVAKRENASIFLEEDYQKNYEGYNPNSPEAHIFGSVWQSAYLEQSILFASLVQENVVNIAGRENKGVKQAGFLVLRATAMPAVLIETGFLTNRNEDEFMASDEGREQMALSILEAFRGYKNQMEGGEIAKTTPAQKLKKKEFSKTGVENGVQKNEKIPPTNERFSSKKEEQIPVAQAVLVKNVEKPTANDTVKHENPAVKPAKIAVKPAENQPEISFEKTATAPSFKILLTTSSKKIDLNGERFDLVPKVEEKKEGSTYHYFVGNFATEKEAEIMQAELRNLGFVQAKVISY